MDCLMWIVLGIVGFLALPFICSLIIVAIALIVGLILGIIHLIRN